ncbi:MAG TPA: hypothetical protein VIK64_02110 [Anaerolineales bacterium]
MAKSEVVTVRLERQPNRRAIERLREAYGRLQQAGRRVEAAGQPQTVQEGCHEPGSCSLCSCIDAPAGARSHD